MTHRNFCSVCEYETFEDESVRGSTRYSDFKSHPPETTRLMCLKCHVTPHVRVTKDFTAQRYNWTGNDKAFQFYFHFPTPPMGSVLVAEEYGDRVDCDGGALETAEALLTLFKAEYSFTSRIKGVEDIIARIRLLGSAQSIGELEARRADLTQKLYEVRKELTRVNFSLECEREAAAEEGAKA